MATSTTGQRTFPALIVVCILLLACLFLGQVSQLWMAHQFPGVSGLARLDPGLIIMDIPVRLPITIDLILVPVLFLLAYTLVILLHPRRRELPHRLGAIFSALIIIGCCVAFGGLIAYLLQDHLPRQVRNGIESLGINADIYLPFTVYKTIHLHGNFIALFSLTIGVAIAIGRINKAPDSRKPTRLSRQQRMTPYERMLQEKYMPAGPAPSKPAQPKAVQPKPAQPKATQPKAVQPKPVPPKPVPPKPIPPKTTQPKPVQSRPAQSNQAQSNQAQSKPAQSQTPQVSPTLLQAPNRPLVATPARALCQPEPLFTLQPEAVNYRPLW